MATHHKVIVIGGGVIGAATACELAQQGVDVAVIDKGKVGHGASYGNAGWICPSHALPLPQPGALRQAAKWMTRPDSPLYIKPRASLEMVRWLLGFLAHANAKHLNYATPILVRFGFASLKRFDEIAARLGRERMGFRKRGLIYACQSQGGLAKATHEVEIASQAGVRFEVLDAAGLRDLEPAITGDVVGGVYLDAEADAEPLMVVKALIEDAQSAGATVYEQAEVFDIETNAGKVVAVRTTKGRLTADRFVLAAGSWSPRFAKSLGLRIPVQAGKGYAMVIEPFDPMPTHPVLLFEKKVAVTPRDTTVRLAGTMELAGLDESITTRRVDAIAAGAREFMNVPDPVIPQEIWRGLRPCTPDGIPMIGAAPGWSNLTLAVGHAMLGLTFAAGTGQLVADLMLGRPPCVDPKPFDPARF